MKSLSIITRSDYKEYIPCSLSFMAPWILTHLEKTLPHSFSIETLVDVIAGNVDGNDSGFLPDLARLEFIYNYLKSSSFKFEDVSSTIINPTLHVIETPWQGLEETLNSQDSGLLLSLSDPGMLLVYINPRSGEVVVKTADANDLLALKLVVEEIGPGELTVRDFDDIIDDADVRGLLIKPKSLIIRDPVNFPKGKNIDPQYFYSDFFTLQWHITQACDLHCRHCYDRTVRVSAGPCWRFKIIKEFRDFCDRRNVRGQISFTGGNPLLHSNFYDFYREAGDKGIYRAVLGNPCTREDVEKILEIGEPEFYQISLEGLEEHNDYIRGEGHFKRSLQFLDLLKELGVYSMVMLTLTRDNMDQVLPLGEILRDRTNRFNFNRLALFGEGANLALPEKDDYRKFLERYDEAALKNPVLGEKDSLINIIKKKSGRELFGGCASHGCGAAFNFVSLLPDGEIHACRKMPSLIGNLNSESLASIYDSPLAGRYRLGTSACTDCEIRPVCGGCPAVTMSCGLDIFIDKDPMCFLD